MALLLQSRLSSSSERIRLPNRWKPRHYQFDLWDYLQSGGKRALAFWHRRAGKDDLCLHWTAVSSQQRVGTYWHMLPEAAQARKAIWDAINPHTGMRRIDEAFPTQLRETTRENEMFIKFRNGSTWQVVGSDNFNSLIGSPPIGIIFSEWAISQPSSWAYLRPILAENGGWALFITTPRGRNHAHAMMAGAQDDPTWFVQRLTADQTGVFSPEQLAHERLEYSREFGADAGENLFLQEYYVSFDAAILGAYWGKEIAVAERDGRICNVPYDPALPVHTAWDLGIGDSTAIWCFQASLSELRIIDCYQASGHGIGHYVDWLDGRGYVYGNDFVPHDARARTMQTGRSLVETMIEMKRRPRIVPSLSIMDGINAVRVSMPKMWFDAVRCHEGIEAIRQYRTDYDQILRIFRDTPKHDWTSHFADAMRYLALAYRQPQEPPPPKAVKDLHNATVDELWALNRSDTGQRRRI